MPGRLPERLLGGRVALDRAAAERGVGEEVAAPLHGCSLAASLGIRRVLVPPAPGLPCAEGLLFADPKAEFSRTLPKAGPVAVDEAAQVLSARERDALARLDAEGADAADRGLAWTALLRHHGQGGETAAPWAETRDAVEAGFADRHRALYGFTLDATTLVPPGWRGVVHASGAIPPTGRDGADR